MYHIVTRGNFSLWADGMDYVVKHNGVEVLRTQNKVRAEREMRHMIETEF